MNSKERRKSIYRIKFFKRKKIAVPLFFKEFRCDFFEGDFCHFDSVACVDDVGRERFFFFKTHLAFYPFFSLFTADAVARHQAGKLDFGFAPGEHDCVEIFVPAGFDEDCGFKDYSRFLRQIINYFKSFL